MDKFSDIVTLPVPSSIEDKNFQLKYITYNLRTLELMKASVKDIIIVLVGVCYIKRVNSMSDCCMRPTASCRQDGTTVTTNQA